MSTRSRPQAVGRRGHLVLADLDFTDADFQFHLTLTSEIATRSPVRRIDGGQTRIERGKQDSPAAGNRGRGAGVLPGRNTSGTSMSLAPGPRFDTVSYPKPRYASSGRLLIVRPSRQEGLLFSYAAVWVAFFEALPNDQ